MAQNVIINGVTYQSVPEVNIPKSGGGTAKFIDNSTVDASSADVRNGVKYGSPSGIGTGTMPENEPLSEFIAGKNSVVTIAEGYHTGTGSVAIAPMEKDKIISANIRSGIEILGVRGDTTVVNTSISTGAATSASILKNYKAYVNGFLVEGDATVPTISQDSSTKVLSIV